MPTLQKSQLTKTKIHISNLDHKIANNFKNLYKLSSQGIINSRLLKNLANDMHRSKSFKVFEFWPRKILKIQNARSLKKIKQYCTSSLKTKYQNQVKTHLIKHIKKTCFNKYLKQLARNSHKSYSYHHKQISFFKNNISKILINFNLTDIEVLLTSFKRKSKKHRLYSKAILNYYQTTKLAPEKSLLGYLDINPRHTRFLQTVDLEKYNTQYVFYKELKQLKVESFNTLKKEDDENLAIASFDRFFNYLNLTYEYQPKEKAMLSLLSLSKSFMRRGLYTQASKGLERILAEKNHHYKDAAFEFMWLHVLQEKYQTALNIANTHTPNAKALKANPKIHFWISFLNLKLNNAVTAHLQLKKIIRQNPLSYYSILSAKILASNSDMTTSELYLTHLNQNISMTSIKDVNPNWLKRIVLWGQIHQPFFLSLEMKSLNTFSNQKDVKNYILNAANQLSLHKEYLKSFKIIYKAINANKIKLSANLLKILFPKPYLKQVQRNTKKFDPIIALSLIRQESGFNTRARSHVGARGLMQLMPNTAKQFRRRVKKKHLYNAKTNIQIGSKYFHKLMRRYDNNVVFSLAAYNAGEGRVDRWQEEYLTSRSILENIENIPYLETRKYVKLIYRNIFFYKMILDQHENESSDLNKIYDLHMGFSS